jgi:hypothetical protein
MADDILAQFRKTPSAASVSATPPKDTDEYVAFGTKDKVQRLRIRSAGDLTNAPGYNVLLNVVYDGRQGTHFMLVYTVLMVLVRGRNLQKLVFAIENGMADYIQEFDAARWQKPADANAPFIESIEVKVVEKGTEAVEAEGPRQPSQQLEH